MLLRVMIYVTLVLGIFIGTLGAVTGFSADHYDYLPAEWRKDILILSGIFAATAAGCVLALIHEVRRARQR